MTSHARRERVRILRQHRRFLEESVRAHVLPQLLDHGFTVIPERQVEGPIDRKAVGLFPFGTLRRKRADGGVDLVEIQFGSYQSASFRINACAVPKGGMMTRLGYLKAEEFDSASGECNSFETYACPRFFWPFSLRFWRFRKPIRADYERLAKKVAALLPEIELALREGKLGPHMRQYLPFPPDSHRWRQHRLLLEESIRTHILPLLLQQGFKAVPLPDTAPLFRRFVDAFSIETLRRMRPEGGADLVEFEFGGYIGPALRINVCHVPRDGIRTLFGHRKVEESCWIAGDCNHFEMLSWPRLRLWFFVPFFQLRRPMKAHYDRLAFRLASFLPEIELAFREGRLGPHMREVVVLPSSQRGNNA